MSENVIKHFPVMINNVISKIRSLQYVRPFKVADCNFGFGGHSRRILKEFPNALVQAYDLDPKVIQYYKDHYESDLKESQRKRLHLINGNFTTLQNTKIFDRFDVVLADFGFNSFHLETERGFSWLKDEELDMRYSPQFKSCAELINNSSQLEITSILEKYGELKGAMAIAEAIVENRPIKTTKQLKESVLKCFQQDKTRKIAQVFQAFRIATNNELKDIEKLCNSIQHCLPNNGIFIGVTFHSLQRDVIHEFIKEKKRFFTKVQTQSPSAEEIVQNSKSRSAKMLSFRKRA